MSSSTGGRSLSLEFCINQVVAVTQAVALTGRDVRPWIAFFFGFVRAYGDTAVTSSRMTAEAKVEGLEIKRQLCITNVWMKRNGKSSRGIRPVFLETRHRVASNKRSSLK
jgi:hypothetical protein